MILSIEKAQQLIERDLKKLAIPAEPAKLYEPVRYILSIGGKRLRPVLVLLACDLFGSDYNKALKAALGIEIFHNFTLLHDDLMDLSTVRRNKPTVHVKWNSNTAILSGDVMSILANNLINQVDSEVIIPVNRLFNKTALEVCEGQMFDLEYSQKENVSISEYLNMIRLKTSVLIAASLGIGALIAGASENDSDTLYNFGLNLGLAFQLQDDLLDSFGDEEVFGKKIGNDILTNKRTFLVIKALETAQGLELLELKKYLSKFDFDPDEKINSVITIFNKLGIREATLDQIKIYHSRAKELIYNLEVPEERKKTLIEFSGALMKREK
jgi:geranylgeranyl diphosphate synthase, type II